MSAAIDFTYRYAFASRIAASPAGTQLALATCNDDLSKPFFFDGRIRSPRTVAEMLLCLSEVVRTHFFLPRPALLDPVLTSNEEILRLEGFSGCCGVYARVDLPREAFEGECHGRGTTNVDFNPPMRAALTRLRDTEELRLAVGRDEVVLTRGDERTVEKKVKLPLRWVKGFSEVQAYQPGLEARFEVDAAQGLRFVRSLPKSGAPKQASFVVRAGRGLRLSQREHPSGVRLLGAHRVRILERLLTRAKTLRVWADGSNGTSAWEVRFASSAFFLMVSPEVYRGFSGEGQNLQRLALEDASHILPRVRAQLAWQSQLDPDDIATRIGVEAAQVGAALTVLGTRGLAGYDVATGRYFHRELPFDLSQVDALQPRLQDARELVACNEVKPVDGTAPEHGEYSVASTDVRHRVRLHPDGDRCTCPWFSKYRGARGPCKHILGARMVHKKDYPETAP